MMGLDYELLMSLPLSLTRKCNEAASSATIA